MRFKKGNKSKSKKRSTKVSSSVKRYVKHEIRIVQEPKYFQKQQTTYAGFDWSGTNPSPISVSSVPQGDTDSQRDGDKLRMFGLQFRYSVVFNPAFGLDFIQNCMVVVFQWFPNSIPALSQILANINFSSVVAPFSFINWDQRDQFKILYKKVHCTSYYSEQAYSREKFIRNFKHKNIQYSSGGVTGTNMIYVCFLSDAGASALPTYCYQTRLLYTDS
nr:MAG: capsid protein [Cressdnaviricota sp.]